MFCHSSYAQSNMDRDSITFVLTCHDFDAQVCNGDQNETLYLTATIDYYYYVKFVERR